MPPDPLSTSPSPVVYPADGTPAEPVPESSTEAIAAAVQGARRAQVGWGSMSLHSRSEAVLQLTRSILERRAEVTAIMSKETGRDKVECLISELTALMSAVKGHLKTAKSALATEHIGLSPLEFPGKSASIEAVPRGVVGIIAPWNYPLGNFAKSLFPALLSGNGVVLKPSEYTPRTGAWLAEQCKAFFPPGLVGLVQGGGTVGRGLIDAGVDSIVFTGSVPSGKKVAAQCAERLIPVSLELGGKDAALVLADCNFERTVAGIIHWSMHNAGQNCAAIERVYVEAPIADRFVEALTKAVPKLRVAPQAGPADLGPMQNEAQLAIVERHVQDAVGKGAKLLAGGKRTGRGLGYEPTLLDRCDETMQIVTDETFGPVIAVIRVANADEGIRRANQSRYGLNGSVWTTDIERGKSLARRLEVGVALVNNHAITGTMSELPWTGVRDTGFGVAQSRHAYATFVRRRALFVDTSKDPDPWWMPASADSAAFGEAVVEMALGSLGATLRLLGLLKKRIATIRAQVTS